jgi:hypothetical protein
MHDTLEICYGFDTRVRLILGWNATSLCNSKHSVSFVADEVLAQDADSGSVPAAARAAR